MEQHELNTIVTEAENALEQSNTKLQSILDERMNDLSEFEEYTILRAQQLLLQYRLDMQTVLNQLNGLQRYLLQLLGLEHQHSFELNKERLSFALGSDDLQHVLSLLNKLVDSLLRVISLTLKNQAENRKRYQKQLKEQKFIDELGKVLEIEKTTSKSLNKLQKDIEHIAGSPKIGLTYTHITALEGPISRFYQAIQNGLILSNNIYQKLNQKYPLTHNIQNTLLKTNQILDNLLLQQDHQRLFTPKGAENTLERLEERANAKRMGHFFYNNI